MKPGRNNGAGAGVLGLGVAACAACCAGPIIGFVGAIVAAGVLGAMFVGVATLVVAALAVAVVVSRRRRRAVACASSTESVALAVPTRRPVERW
jgi:mercuric ion transport protein